MKTTFLFLLLNATMLLTTLSSFSQREEIEQTIQQLFDGMRSRDSALVSTLFAPGTLLQTTYINKSNKPQIYPNTVQGFLDAIGTPHAEVWDERISNLIIQVDGALAHAWMDYSFFLGAELKHCGVNSMTLFYNGERWQIIHLIDTHRNEDCN